MLIRQGDVLIGDETTWPELANVKRGEKRPDIVLARGEMTGHAHRATAGELYASDVPGVHVFDSPAGGTTVKHEEHATVDVPPGRWFVRQKREYNHLEEEANEVID